MDDHDEAQTRTFCIRENIPFPFRWVSGEEGVDRFLQKCKGKALERVDGPLILCVNQICTLPDPRIGVQLIHEVAGWAETDPGSELVAVCYFIFDRFQAMVVAQNPATRLGVVRHLFERVEEAMRKY